MAEQFLPQEIKVSQNITYGPKPNIFPFNGIILHFETNL